MQPYASKLGLFNPDVTTAAQKWPCKNRCAKSSANNQIGAERIKYKKVQRSPQ